MNVEIKQMQELRTATQRHIGPYNRISEAFARLCESAGRAGLLGTNSTTLAIYHDDPETTPEAELRSDAAVVISEDAEVPQGLVEQRLAAGRYACTLTWGPTKSSATLGHASWGSGCPRAESASEAA